MSNIGSKGDMQTDVTTRESDINLKKAMPQDPDPERGASSPREEASRVPESALRTSDVEPRTECNVPNAQLRALIIFVAEAFMRQQAAIEVTLYIVLATALMTFGEKARSSLESGNKVYAGRMMGDLFGDIARIGGSSAESFAFEIINRFKVFEDLPFPLRLSILMATKNSHQSPARRVAYNVTRQKIRESGMPEGELSALLDFMNNKMKGSDRPLPIRQQGMEIGLS